MLNGSQTTIAKVPSLVADTQPRKDSLKKPLNLECIGLLKVVAAAFQNNTNEPWEDNETPKAPNEVA
jgi:hypothetical protein